MFFYHLLENISSTNNYIRKENFMLATVKELSARLNVKESWIRSKIFKNEIPFIKLGHLVRFKMSDIELWLNDQSQGTSPPESRFRFSNTISTNFNRSMYE